MLYLMERGNRGRNISGLTLRSVSAVAAGFWRGLRGWRDSAGMADTLLLD